MPGFSSPKLLAKQSTGLNIQLNPQRRSTMEEKHKKRREIPSAAAADVLIRSRRRCCFCFFWDNDLDRKDGQIAHVDHNPSNSRRDNLAFLCFQHHNEYDRRNSQGRNLSKEELYYARELLYQALAGNRKPRWLVILTLAQDFASFTTGKQKELLKKIQEIIQRDGALELKQKRPGSVVLSFEMSQNETERLFAAIAAGKLEIFGLSSAELEECESNTSRISFPTREWTPKIQTVVELDLVGYSAIGKTFEQGLDARSVFQLNQQIQSFIDAGLAATESSREKTLAATIGDGAILVFDSPSLGFRFAQAVQVATREHNHLRHSPFAKRVFRIGITTGEIVVQPKIGGGFEIAGAAISRAVRLESKAPPGGVLIDEATFEKLSLEERKGSSEKLLIAGKAHDEHFPAFSFQFNADGPRDSTLISAQEHPAAPNDEGSKFARWLVIPEREWSGTPSSLLRADLAVVPFHGREMELSELGAWVKNEAGSMVRVLTGSGGMGKTRLARELCILMHRESVESGFVARSDLEDCLASLKTIKNSPMLLVMDYAETEESRIAKVIRIATKRKLTSMRILLLARGAGFWWSRLKRAGEGVGESLRVEPQKLRPLAFDLNGRVSSYRLAARSFAEKLGKENRSLEVPDLTANLYERSLLLHMKALLSMQGGTGEEMDSILENILSREVGYWASFLQYRGLPKMLEPGFARAMGIISACRGVADRQKAVDLISRIRFFRDQPRAVIEAVADILHDCYAGESWIEPIQPDLLMEYLIAKATADDPADFDALLLPKGMKST